MTDKIENEFLSIEIDRLGAELKSIKDKNNIEYLWQGDKKYWTGRAYNLFPIVGRLEGKEYLYKGKKYSLDCHGFIRNTELKLKKINEVSVTYYLEKNLEIESLYPFDFYYEVQYVLEKNKLFVKYFVKNKGVNEMYFGLGGHPGINVPFDKGEFNDYYLEFDREAKPISIFFDKDGLNTGKEEIFQLQENKIKNLDYKIFEEDGIYLKNADKSVTLKSKKSIHSVKVSYPDMPYIAFWTKEKVKAPYLCIEPWQSLPSPKLDKIIDIENKPDMIKLKQSEEYANGFSIEIK